MNGANYEIVERDAEKVVLRDLGPWSQHPTITNDAEQVVEETHQVTGNRRLLYYDSDGELTELVHDGPRFVRFAFVNPEVKRQAEAGGEHGV